MKNVLLLLSLAIGLLTSALQAQELTLDEAQYDLGLSLYISGRYDYAIEEFRFLDERYPASAYLPDGYYWLAMSQLAQRDFTNATLSFLETMRRFPMTAVYKPSLYSLAQCFYQRGMRAQAKQRFNEFLSKFAGDDLADNALFWTGVIAWKDGKDDDAVAVFDRQLNRYPSGNKAEAAKYMKLLIKGGGGPKGPSQEELDRMQNLEDWENLLQAKEEALNAKEDLNNTREKGLDEKERQVQDAATKVLR